MTITASAFDSARLKAQRANHHIDELQSVAAAFAATPFYEIVAHQDAGGNRIAIVPLQPIPNTLPLIVGDAIHNLRSALDHLATGCSTVGGGKGKDLFFPLSQSKEGSCTGRLQTRPDREGPPRREAADHRQNPAVRGRERERPVCPSFA